MYAPSIDEEKLAFFAQKAKVSKILNEESEQMRKVMDRADGLPNIIKEMFKEQMKIRMNDPIEWSVIYDELLEIIECFSNLYQDLQKSQKKLKKQGQSDLFDLCKYLSDFKKKINSIIDLLEKSLIKVSQISTEHFNYIFYKSKFVVKEISRFE